MRKGLILKTYSEKSENQTLEACNHIITIGILAVLYASSRNYLTSLGSSKVSAGLARLLFGLFLPQMFLKCSSNVPRQFRRKNIRPDEIMNNDLSTAFFGGFRPCSGT